MEFNNLKTRCAYSYCKQLEYLPVGCSSCEKKFCPQHSKRESHECKAKEKGNRLILECPMCLKRVPYLSSEDADSVLNFHVGKGECDPKSYNSRIKKSKKLGCKVPSCNFPLTVLTSFNCSHCNFIYCKNHRHRENHECKAGRNRIGQG